MMLASAPVCVECPPLPTNGALVHTRRGRVILARPVTPGDTRLLADLLGQLSRRTLFLRYLQPRPALPDELAWQEAIRLAHGHAPEHAVLIGLVCEDGLERAVAVAEFVRDAQHHTMAELALLVADAYQGEGIGTALSAQLMNLAAQHRIRIMQAITLVENKAIRRLFAKSGWPFSAETSQGLTVFQATIA